GGSFSPLPGGTYRGLPPFSPPPGLLAAPPANQTAIGTVHTDLTPTDQFITEAQDAVASGWSAKACIHPAQVPVVRQAYTPSPDEIEYAQALLSEVNQHGGAFQFRGSMVDGPLIAHAQNVLQRADRLLK